MSHLTVQFVLSSFFIPPTVLRSAFSLHYDLIHRLKLFIPRQLEFFHLKFLSGSDIWGYFWGILFYLWSKGYFQVKALSIDLILWVLVLNSFEFQSDCSQDRVFLVCLNALSFRSEWLSLILDLILLNWLGFLNFQFLQSGYEPDLVF